METQNHAKQVAAEPPHPYDAFRGARNNLMHSFLSGLGDLETQLIAHDRGNERKLETVRAENLEQAKEIIRLSAELAHRPLPAGWILQDLGEQPAIDAATVQEGSRESITEIRRELADKQATTERIEGELAAERAVTARLEGELSNEQGSVRRLTAELAEEKKATAKLERDYRTLEEKIDDDQRNAAGQEASRQERDSELALRLVEADENAARLSRELAEATGKVSEAEVSLSEAKEARDAEKGRADAAQGELEQLKAEPAPEPAEVDVQAARAAAADEAKDRVATIIVAIETDNPGIRLNDALELFAAAWAAPVVQEAPYDPSPQLAGGSEDGDQEEAVTADLFDFTLPPPNEDADIPYVPNAAAVGS